MKGIGIGTSDFKKLRVKDYYFIDKSMYIKDIMDNKSEIVLITRPRRFGKTLNISMLKYYFDCTAKDNQELFNGLKIMEQGEQYTSKLGYYPVIYITLKDVQGTSYENMLIALKIQMNEIFIEYADKLLKSDKLLDIEKEMFNTIVNLKANEVEGYYDKTVKFFKTFYGVTFKDNPYLEKTVITGVSRVAKESIFSGANNFDVYTVLQDNEFDGDFGITAQEMEKVLEDFEVQEEKEEIKKWYDGYSIGNTKEIYNPWSILNYLKRKELMPYWVNTSSNDLIKLILKNSTTTNRRKKI